MRLDNLYVVSILSHVIMFNIYRKLNLLSFGEEAQEEEKELAAVKTKIKSSHDVLNDPRLLKDENAKDKLVSIHIFFLFFLFLW